MQIGILEKKDFSDEAFKKLKAMGKVELFDGKKIKNFLFDKEILFIRLKYFIGKELLDSAPKLKFVCTPTTGLNHLDLKELKKRNIKLVSLKGEKKFLSNVRATPEHTLGLLLSLLRNYKTAFLNDKNMKWDRDTFKGFEIFGKNIGIIGLGRVGKILAKYFSALGAKVYFNDIDRSIKPVFGAERFENLKKMIEKSDIIFMCASYDPKYHEFFDKKYIDLMKNKYFINTARGELIDEEYLIKKIRSNFFKGVALDVINNETGKNNLSEIIQIAKNRNFILTPHIAGATYESMTGTEIFIANNLKKMIKGNQ
jgi:D-3-phosphoglycerate dehydrogenase